MKNKKQIFSVVLLLLLFIGSQSIFGQNLKATRGNIESLEQRIEDFIKQPSASREKKDKAKIILNNLGELKKKADSLSEDSSKIELDEINSKYETLANEFKPQNSSPNAPPTTSSNPQTSQTSTKPLAASDDSRGLKDKAETMEDTTFLENLSWITLSLIGLAGLLVLAGISTGAYFLWRNKQHEREEIALNFKHLNKQQKKFGDEIKQLTEVSKNLSQQIAQQKSEIGSLKQVSQNTSQAAPPLMATLAHQPPVEVSQFPVMVSEYLAKVKNGARPVKFDYKEKMLVEDNENEGHLLIVRDTIGAGGAFYLVPSFGIFQTKSDYTTYFENYYNCARPMGGSVWIRQPATVKNTNGGWQLEQKGELEVR